MSPHPPVATISCSLDHTYGQSSSRATLTLQVASSNYHPCQSSPCSDSSSLLPSTSRDDSSSKHVIKRDMLPPFIDTVFSQSPRIGVPSCFDLPSSPLLKLKYIHRTDVTFLDFKTRLLSTTLSLLISGNVPFTALCLLHFAESTKDIHTKLVSCYVGVTWKQKPQNWSEFNTAYNYKYQCTTQH